MDPGGSGSGIGKAAEELMQEMQKAQQDLNKMGPKQSGVQGGAAFQQVLQAQQAQTTGQVQGAKEATQVNKAAGILAQARIDAKSPSTRVGAAARAEKSKLANLLNDLINGQDKMTNIMNMALSGRQFSPPELLAMQAGVYRFSQELELTSKVVEKATSGIKQTMNTQV